MAVVGKKLNYNDWKDLPTSKLSKNQFITKPENRVGAKPVSTVANAEKVVAGLGSGK